MTREGLIEAIMESLLDPDEWSLKPGKSRDINFEARLRKQYPKDSYTELWNRRRTISRERWLRGDVLHRPNQHDPTATKAQRRFGKMTSGPPRRRELEISAPDQPPLRVPMGRKNQNKEAGGKFKALMTDRIADISAKEQGVKVRGKRRQTIRGLAYEAPRRGTASWKQHKQGRQYEELIEDILEAVFKGKGQPARAAQRKVADFLSTEPDAMSKSVFRHVKRESHRPRVLGKTYVYDGAPFASVRRAELMRKKVNGEWVYYRNPGKKEIDVMGAFAINPAWQPKSPTF